MSKMKLFQKFPYGLAGSTSHPYQNLQRLTQVVCSTMQTKTFKSNDYKGSNDSNSSQETSLSNAATTKSTSASSSSTPSASTTSSSSSSSSAATTSAINATVSSKDGDSTQKQSFDGSVSSGPSSIKDLNQNRKCKTWKVMGMKKKSTAKAAQQSSARTTTTTSTNKLYEVFKEGAGVHQDEVRTKPSVEDILNSNCLETYEQIMRQLEVIQRQVIEILTTCQQITKSSFTDLPKKDNDLVEIKSTNSTLECPDCHDLFSQSNGKDVDSQIITPAAATTTATSTSTSTTPQPTVKIRTFPLMSESENRFQRAFKKEKFIREKPKSIPLIKCLMKNDNDNMNSISGLEPDKNSPFSRLDYKKPGNICTEAVSNHHGRSRFNKTEMSENVIYMGDKSQTFNQVSGNSSTTTNLTQGPSQAPPKFPATPHPSQLTQSKATSSVSKSNSTPSASSTETTNEEEAFTHNTNTTSKVDGNPPKQQSSSRSKAKPVEGAAGPQHNTNTTSKVDGNPPKKQSSSGSKAKPVEGAAGPQHNTNTTSKVDGNPLKQQSSSRSQANPVEGAAGPQHNTNTTSKVDGNPLKQQSSPGSKAKPVEGFARPQPLPKTSESSTRPEPYRARTAMDPRKTVFINRAAVKPKSSSQNVSRTSPNQQNQITKSSTAASPAEIPNQNKAPVHENGIRDQYKANSISTNKQEKDLGSEKSTKQETGKMTKPVENQQQKSNVKYKSKPKYTPQPILSTELVEEAADEEDVREKTDNITRMDKASMKSDSDDVQKSDQTKNNNEYVNPWVKVFYDPFKKN